MSRRDSLDHQIEEFRNGVESALDRFIEGVRIWSRAQERAAWPSNGTGPAMIKRIVALDQSGLSRREIMRETRRSKSHVNNVLRLKRGLHPTIYEKYVNRPGVASQITIPELLELVPLSREGQLRKFRQMLETQPRRAARKNPR